MKYKHICMQCGKSYKNYKAKSNFCSNNCKQKHRESITYDCDNCGKTFVTVQSKLDGLKNGEHKHLFCSRECANEFQKNSVRKRCEYCGKEFDIVYSFKDVQKFCSRECYDKYRQKQSNKLHKLCPNCKKTFYTYHKSQVYCSRKCAGEASQNRVSCICEYCGKSFDRIKSEYDKNAHHYCSQECKILSKAWSHSDIEILKKYYGKISMEEISSLIEFKRSYTEIRRKAQWLGLGKDRSWSESEIDILKKFYSNIPMHDVLKMLPNRTFPSIKGKANSLNLISYGNLNKFYSSEDDEYIKNNYLTQTDEELGQKLNRTPSAISQRIYKLDLHRPLEKHNYITLNNYVRAKLYMWKQAYREKCNYTCQLSGLHSNIVVHHIYGFNLLMEETIELLNFPIYEDLDKYSQEELDLFVKTFLELQEYYGEYICVAEDIHKNFHSIYGYGDNTKEQWDEFVDKYYKEHKKAS